MCTYVNKFVNSHVHKSRRYLRKTLPETSYPKSHVEGKFLYKDSMGTSHNYNKCEDLKDIFIDFIKSQPFFIG